MMKYITKIGQNTGMLKNSKKVQQKAGKGKREKIIIIWMGVILDQVYWLFCKTHFFLVTQRYVIYQLEVRQISRKNIFYKKKSLNSYTGWSIWYCPILDHYCCIFSLISKQVFLVLSIRNFCPFWYLKSDFWYSRIWFLALNHDNS